jgi:hypothetical protein
MKDPTKHTKIGILRLKIYHLATLGTNSFFKFLNSTLTPNAAFDLAVFSVCSTFCNVTTAFDNDYRYSRKISGTSQLHFR